MDRLLRWLAPTTTARAHCDLPCGVYDPEQARIEAESCLRIIEKYAGQRRRDLPRPGDRHQGGARRARQAPPRRPVARLLQARAPREGAEPPRAVLERRQAGSKVKASTDPADGQEAARHDRRDRRRLEGDRRRREDPGRRPARPDRHRIARCHEAPPDGGASSSSAARRVRGPWRVAVERGSMVPAIEPGDWLLVDPTTARWPRRGRSSSSASRMAAPSRSSASRPVRARASRSPTATSTSPTTRPGCWPTRHPSRRRPPASATPSTRAGSAPCRSSCSSGGSGSATRRGAGSAASRPRRTGAADQPPAPPG